MKYTLIKRYHSRFHIIHTTSKFHINFSNWTLLYRSLYTKMATLRHHIREAICKIWLRPWIIHGRRCIKTNLNIYVSNVIKMKHLHKTLQTLQQ
jgi:hypothetical protein